MGVWVSCELQTPENEFCVAEVPTWKALLLLTVGAMVGDYPDGTKDAPAETLFVIYVAWFAGVVLKTLIFGLLMQKIMTAPEGLCFAPQCVHSVRDGQPCLKFSICHKF